MCVCAQVGDTAPCPGGTRCGKVRSPFLAFFAPTPTLTPDLQGEGRVSNHHNPGQTCPKMATTTPPLARRGSLPHACKTFQQTVEVSLACPRLSSCLLTHTGSATSHTAYRLLPTLMSRECGRDSRTIYISLKHAGSPLRSATCSHANELENVAHAL